MPLPGTPHCARFSLLFTFGTDGQKCENTFYIQDETDAIFADPVVFATGVLAIANTTLKPMLDSNVLITGMGFEDVRTFPFGGLEVGQAGAAGTYTIHGSNLPSSVAFSIRKNTATLGRSGRGRWYWPIGGSAHLSPTNDTVLALSISNWISGLEAFQTAVEAYLSPGKMGIVSYRTANAQRSEGLFSQITSWSAADSNVDSQRRRLTGRGK